jgi:hypothetical protein
MTGSSTRQFGLIIAYLLPGFVALAGLAPLFPAVGRWLAPVSAGAVDLGLGPPLYAILGAMTLGMVISCFRFLLIDQLHGWMGVRRPTWDDSRLDEVLHAFEHLVDAHYRHYQSTANLLLAVLWAYGLNRVSGALPFLGPVTDFGAAVLVVALFVASRSALSNYYDRSRRLIGGSALNMENSSCSTETITAAAVRAPRNQNPTRSRSNSPR